MTSVSLKSVLDALEQYRVSGRQNFLAKHGFNGRRRLMLWYDGDAYDAIPVLMEATSSGCAEPQRPEIAPPLLKNRAAEMLLKELGFAVSRPCRRSARRFHK